MLDFARFYHVGIVVPDLQAALEEHRARGVRFQEPIVGMRMAQGPSGPIRMDLKACNGEAPACIEIIEEMPGTIWTSGEHGRLHHIAFVADDLEAESARLEGAGWSRVAWSPVGWVYHESPFGYYVELISKTLRARHGQGSHS